MIVVVHEGGQVVASHSQKGFSSVGEECDGGIMGRLIGPVGTVKKRQFPSWEGFNAWAEFNETFAKLNLW